MYYSRWAPHLDEDGLYAVRSNTYGDVMRRYPKRRYDRAQAFADLLNREEVNAAIRVAARHGV
jgi:hypothetical protein